ncbi:MAG: DUF3089 domain-containing protein [Solirubrobacterales bacterium]|nr:DUF3089 domain-containing protein [Solirubrobacterales bacterium]
MWARRGILAAVLGLVCLAVAPSVAPAQAKPVWLCKPGLADNPCKPGLGTTLASPSGEPLRTERVKADKRPKIDCFYVYPTVSDDPTPNSDLTVDPEERSIALYQAARYSQHCRVFAPMYRQITLSQLLGGGAVTERMRRTAYSDVAAAWKAYLRKYNRGRAVVLIGHSQGTGVLRQLIADRIDPRRSVRERVVSAILLGGDVLVEKGRDVGGDFDHIRACRSAKQLGCVVAFSTFDAPVPADSLFGRPGNALFGGDPDKQDVLCVNPAALGGGSGRLDTIFPSAPFAPGTTIGAATALVGTPRVAATTPWVEFRGAYSGRCSSADDANVLQLTDAPGAPHLNPVPEASWGLHLVDANIALGNLVRLVGRQAKRYERESG